MGQKSAQAHRVVPLQPRAVLLTAAHRFLVVDARSRRALVILDEQAIQISEELLMPEWFGF